MYALAFRLCEADKKSVHVARFNVEPMDCTCISCNPKNV